MQPDHYHQHIAKKKKLNFILYAVTATLVLILGFALIATW
jgi:Tfp pilus assembly protein PilN